MGLESIQIPEKRKPRKAPIREDIIERIGDYVVTKTYHGPVFEERDRPQFIRFNLIDTSFEDRIIKKQTPIFHENHYKYIEHKENIIHTAKVINGIKTNYLEQ